MFDQLKGKKVIVRGYASGVNYGTVEEITFNHGNYVSIHLSEARRIWYWEGAFTLNAVAERGINNKSRLSVVCNSQYVYDCCEILECSEEAIKCIDTLQPHS